jgi:WD40 repeat protein/serine/threonine protein kinase
MRKKPIFSLDPDQLERLFLIGTGGQDPAEEAQPQADASEQGKAPVDAASGEQRPPGEAPSANVTASLVGMDQPGSQIGRYKLLRVLGEGGFGIVYLAEQQRPMRRQVALKIIKPGMDSTQVIRRFEAERQALALLDHPNVAHVYDAGTTEAGRPYFAMEYVKGVPITEHCDRQKLTIEERLKLFVQVCEAIQHAHQKGIIHRDIKPSNIQVCIQGEQVIPKVIDFGVAKALSQPLTDRTLVTEQGQLIGTPEYISPEQAEMTNQDIDTRSDIYSLGVLLYELLTGTLPFESKTLRRGSLEQMRAVLREEEPKTPSTRVHSLDGQASTKLAKRCQSDAAALRRGLRGDLDWITLKAMEKDRMRRYQTAHALAEDIERHLKQEPVLAGPPGTLYRFQKLVRRNKGVFAGVTVVAAALVIGLTISVVSLIREQQARRVAVAAQEKETAQRRKAEALAYASDMSLAQEALARDDMGRARRLLETHRPAPGEVDLRGWEWRYLWQECRSDALDELCRYPNTAMSVAYSPDGKLLAVAGLIQNFVDIWDVASRKKIRTLQLKEGHLVAFSPRGDLLATDAGNQIRLWRTDTWECVQELDTGGRPVVVFKFSPDGRRLACMSHSKNNEAVVWEVGQWTEKPRRIHGVTPVSWHSAALDFSPDSNALVTGDADGHLQVFDLASGDRILDVPKAHPEVITSVAWSPNGSIIASGSGYSGGPIQLWNAASGKPLGKLEGHTFAVYKLVFSATGLLLYSASADQTIRIWDVGAQRLLATLRGSGDELLGLALSPADGTTLASACKDGVVAFWSAQPRPEEQQPRLIPLGRLGWGAFAPHSRVLAVPRAGTVSLLDLATLREVEQIPELGTDVYRVLYSPDGTLLVSMDRSGRMRVWSCADRRLLLELNDPNTSIYPIGFRSDGRRLLSVDGKGKAIWWDILTWQPIQTFVLEMKSHSTETVSPDGRLLAVGTGTGAVHWLNAETGGVLATGSDAHRSVVPGIAFSADGKRAASVAWDGTVALWDLSSFRRMTGPFFKGHMMGALAVTFSPDGRLATCSVSREAVRLWDPSTHRELMTLPGQGSNFYSWAFSPDGRWLAVCSAEGQLHLWRAPSWEEIEAEEKSLKSGQSP